MFYLKVSKTLPTTWQRKFWYGGRSAFRECDVWQQQERQYFIWPGNVLLAEHLLNNMTFSRMGTILKALNGVGAFSGTYRYNEQTVNCLDISHLTACYASCLQRKQSDVLTVIPPWNLLITNITLKLHPVALASSKNLVKCFSAAMHRSIFRIYKCLWFCFPSPSCTKTLQDEADQKTLRRTRSSPSHWHEDRRHTAWLHLLCS